MNDFEKRMLKELAEAQEKIKGLECQCKDIERNEKEHRYEAGLYSAMLADIVGLIFGRNAEGAPGLISYPHAGWVCGPVTKNEDETFVEFFFRSGKEVPDEKKIKEWKRFLALLSKMRAPWDIAGFMKKVSDEG